MDCILGHTPKTEGACHTSAKSDWKKRAVHGFYKRKSDKDGHTYYVRIVFKKMKDYNLILYIKQCPESNAFKQLVEEHLAIKTV